MISIYKNIPSADYKTWICYSLRLAGYLMQRGFVLVAMKPDKKHARRNVFFFNESQELHDAVGDYMANKQ